MMRVAVFGASGFAGTAVVERLLARKDVEVLAVIHSDGSAWRLFRRLDVTLQQVDILSRQHVRDALKGVTHVVNCTRGTDDVMLNGLKILLEEAKQVGVQRFVHISSVLIYGDTPSPNSVSESAPPDPQTNAYGILKLKQDQMVQAAARAGLPSTILCPPNIIGPSSYLLSGLINMIKQDQFGLMDNGNTACVTVDVANLAKAIELALLNGNGDGTRYFVTDNYNTTWAELTKYLLPLTGKTKAISISKQDIERHITAPKVSYNPVASLKHLVGSNVREALRLDPMLCKVDMFFRGIVAKLPGDLEEKVRLTVEGPTAIAKVTNAAPINWQFCSAQMRGVFHSCDLAQKELNYTPEVTFHESMKAYIKWHNTMRGYDTEFASILKRLV
ncbi:NAD-dependent epimerase/dehydratase family protein [Nitrospira sp. M1]